VVGAILAIPTAATLQIVVREYVDYRREGRLSAGGRREPPAPGASGASPATT
jgi:predicted PurR-regulated permease PerM